MLMQLTEIFILFSNMFMDLPPTSHIMVLTVVHSECRFGWNGVLYANMSHREIPSLSLFT